MPKHTNDRLQGTLDLLILKALFSAGPLHGYAIARRIRLATDDSLRIEEGSLYPALQRLLKAKLVKAEWGISSTNRRVRTYQITASGLRYLEKQISSFERMFEGISLVLDPGKSGAN